MNDKVKKLIRLLDLSRFAAKYKVDKFISEAI